MTRDERRDDLAEADTRLAAPNDGPKAGPTVDPSITPAAGLSRETPGYAPTAGLADELMKGSIKAELFHKPQPALKIGRFVLIERLAAGGMGEIFTAYDERLDRKVAVKLVRPDVDSSESTASIRLLREAQTLARLSHPNVVPIYEAGVFRNRVYLAMELIRGVTLRDWVESQEPGRKTWRAILAKYIDAGRGLRAVHNAGLVHRDFKPDNVLVGGDGRVRLVDFGLAYAEPTEPGYDADEGDMLTTLDSSQEPPRGAPGTADPVPRLQRVVRLTITGALVGTPAYMSPEQMDGNPTDARGDQFSFCVALYEALFGARPFAADDLSGLGAMIRSGSISAPPRGTRVPARIWKVLERGLAYEPGDRYRDMAELLDALSWSTTRRRHWLAAGVAVAALAVAGGLALERATAPEDPCGNAGAGVAEAWSPSARASARDAFIASGLPHAEDSLANVEARAGEYAAALTTEYREACLATRLRREQSSQILALRSQCLDQRLLRFEALTRGLAEANRDLVERSPRAGAELPAIASCRNPELLSLGVEPPKEPRQAQRVAQLRRHLAEAQIHGWSGRRNQAVQRIEAQLAAARAEGYAPALAEALHALGSHLLERPRGDEVERARSSLLEAVDLAESQRHDELAADTWNRLLALAVGYSRVAPNGSDPNGSDPNGSDPNDGSAKSAGDREGSPELSLELGVEWGRRALATSARVRDGGRRRAEALHRLGQLHARHGDLALAERYQRQALEIIESGAIPRLFAAHHWHGLGDTLRARSRLDSAREAYERALESFRAELGATSARAARLSGELGTLLHQSGELGGAREHLESARAAWIQLHGPEHHNVALAHLRLADLDRESGALERAENHARSAREILVRSRDPNHPEQSAPELLLGRIYLRGGRLDDSLAAYERALAIHQHDPSRDPFRAAVIHGYLGEALVALGRLDHGLAALHNARQKLAASGRDSAPISARILKSRGLAHLAQGDIPAARGALERALTLLLSVPGNQLERADVQWALAQALRAGGQWPDERTRALAEGARASYGRYGSAGERYIRTIDQWLSGSSPGGASPEDAPPH